MRLQPILAPYPADTIYETGLLEGIGPSPQSCHLLEYANSGGAASQSTSADAEYVLRRLHPATAPYGNLGRNAFRTPRTRASPSAMGLRSNSGQSSSTPRITTNFGIPDSKTTHAAFGTIRATYPSRQIQFALKLLF
jgi:hypothetical protein